jgi:hypothetical protein
MALLAGQLAHRSGDGRVEFRDESVRATWQFDQVMSSDGQLVRCVFSCAVRLPPEAVERRAFAETFLGGADTATVAGVIRHFTTALQAALLKLTSNTPADQITETGVRDALLAAAKPVAFDCGVELSTPASVHLLCTSKLQTQARSALTAQAAAQQADETSPCRIWTAAGNAIIAMHSNDGFAEMRTVELPTTLGPLRSIRACDDGLLVGAKTGVYRTTAIGTEPASYLAGNVESAHGFNAAQWINSQLIATHSQAGLVWWNGEERERPAGAIAMSSAKLLTTLDSAGAAIFAANDRTLLFEHGQVAPIEGLPNGEIIALLETFAAVIVVYSDGAIWEIERWTRRATKVRNVPGVVAAAAISGGSKIITATEDGRVRSFVLGDESVTEFVSPHLGLRAIAALGAVIAAVSPDRQRVVIWNASDPRRPAIERHVGAVARHRLVDLVIVPHS